MNPIVAVLILSCVTVSTSGLAQEVKQSERQTTMRRLGAWPGVDLRASTPSPDGRYFSSVDWWSGNLILHDLATGENRRLTNDGSWPRFAYFSAISPDGKEVAYTWFHPFGGPDSSSCDLRIVGVDGSVPRVLYHDQAVWNISPKAWSPDGKQILAIFSRKDRTNQIVLLSVVDGSVQVLKSPFHPPDIYNFKMSFSPDGRFIVYNVPQKDSHAYDITLLSSDGSREISLVQHPANDILLGWEPDGNRVLFASDRRGAFGAWVIQVVDGGLVGSPELVRPDIGPNFLPMGFTQSGAYYYGAMSATTDLYIATFDPAAGKLRTAPTLVKQFRGYHTAPDWSRDGRYLAYVSERSIMPGDAYPLALSIRSVETGQERELPLRIHGHQGGFQQRPRWSPDGRFFLLEGEYTGHGGYRVDAKTGAATKIWTAPDGDDHGYSAWSPDGKTIFYRRPRRIVAQDLQAGHETELYRLVGASDVRSLALSPNGQQFAFVRLDENDGATALNVLPTTGGEPRELLRVRRPEMISYLDWIPDGRQLIFGKEQATGEKQRVEFWRLSAQGGEPETLGLAIEGESLYGLSVHPDGRRIAFTVGHYNFDTGLEVWVMDNFLPPLKLQRQEPK